MIHINQDMLEAVYQKLYDYSNKYILIAEYFNPSPVEIGYRGHSERMYKRDFCREMQSLYPDLALIDYGVTYSQDRDFFHDDINWYLLSKL